MNNVTYSVDIHDLTAPPHAQVPLLGTEMNEESSVPVADAYFPLVSHQMSYHLRKNAQEKEINIAHHNTAQMA